MRSLRQHLVAALLITSAPATLPAQSIARDWNERILQAIRNDTPHPPAQARNLFSLSICMYDAWAAYDTNGAVGYLYRGKHAAQNVAAARREAISYAAYRILNERYAYSRTASSTLASLHTFMASLGYSTNNFSTDTSTPAGVGNSIYAVVSGWFSNDGARQTNGIAYPLANPPVAYPDYPPNQGGYVYTNYPLATDRPGISDGQIPAHTIVDINRWQRLQIVNAVDQNGFPQGPVQNYLGAQWLGVWPFALTRSDEGTPWIDLAGPPPFCGTATHAAFQSNVVEVISRSSHLTPDDGILMNISPGAFGNNALGANEGTGHPVNPVTGQPYAPNVVKRGDFVRVLAEYWADGPNSETPPGHWNVVANLVADNTNTVKRIGGAGPIVDNLEWDVKAYFALNAAVHDAACAAWSLKRYYDGWRPLSAIRYMGMLGQCTAQLGPSYHTNGLPLITNLIELVTPATVGSGRHSGLTPGKIAILSWPGQPSNPVNQHSGVRWIHAESWLPYQKANFVTPAFPGYVSGHSTFSRAAAEVLTAITGSPFFPGGLFTASTAIANTPTGLTFEYGPTQPLQLQCATYYDAADQAGISRIWGGIHPPADDFTGRRTGAQCGSNAWALAKTYFDGSITNAPTVLSIRSLNPSQCELRFGTLRGFRYELQSATSAGLPFTNHLGGLQLATNTSIVRAEPVSSVSRFFRVIRTP